MYSKFSEMSV